MTKLDLTEIENNLADTVPSSHTLDPETVQLALTVLQEKAPYIGAWLDDDQPISVARWDTAERLVDRAILQVMTPGEPLAAPIPETDGGGADPVQDGFINGGFSFDVADTLIDGGNA